MTKQKTIAWRTANDGLGDTRSIETGLDIGEDRGLTIQSGKDDADINVIMKRFGLGRVPLEHQRQPLYGDLTELPNDYHDSLNQIQDTQNKFNSLPAAVRAKFKNNPYELIEFIADPENKEQAEKMGLLKPKPVEVKPPIKQETPEPTPKA